MSILFYFGDVWLCNGQSNMGLTVKTDVNGTQWLRNLRDKKGHPSRIIVSKGKKISLVWAQKRLCRLSKEDIAEGERRKSEVRRKRKRTKHERKLRRKRKTGIIPCNKNKCARNVFPRKRAMDKATPPSLFLTIFCLSGHLGELLSLRCILRLWDNNVSFGNDKAWAKLTL